jgi:hypothetical protein
VFDFTDAAHPVEIAFFDRGPLDPKNVIIGGVWSAYWYNGEVYASEMARGLDVFQLTPSDHLTQNEIDAASQVRVDVLNPQLQTKAAWPATPVTARAYLDQLTRSKALPAERVMAIQAALGKANKKDAAASQELDALAGQLQNAALNGVDGRRAAALADTMKEIAAKLR